MYQLGTLPKMSCFVLRRSSLHLPSQPERVDMGAMGGIPAGVVLACLACMALPRGVRAQPATEQGEPSREEPPLPQVRASRPKCDEKRLFD